MIISSSMCEAAITPHTATGENVNYQYSPPVLVKSSYYVHYHYLSVVGLSVRTIQEADCKYINNSLGTSNGLEVLC